MVSNGTEAGTIDRTVTESPKVSFVLLLVQSLKKDISPKQFVIMLPLAPEGCSSPPAVQRPPLNPQKHLRAKSIDMSPG